MKWLILIFMLSLVTEIVVYDKTYPHKWLITNDTVMGGISSSSTNITEDGTAVFSGSVSIENNGGFAMTRLPLDVKLTQDHTKIVLKFKGDGKQYQLRLKSNEAQRYWYVKPFKTTNGLQEIDFQLTDFYPSFRGYKLNISNFSANTIKELAILIGNKKDENFRIEIEKITIQ